MVPCGAYQYCIHLSTQQFCIVYYSTTRGTFSKNVQRGTIFLFRMKLTWYDTMWCSSILYTFTYPTILHWSITLPPEGLLGKIIFKYPLISTLPFILQAEGILLNICHIINVYCGPILQEINGYIACMFIFQNGTIAVSNSFPHHHS